MAPAAEVAGASTHRIERALEELVSHGALRVPPYPAVARRVQEVLSSDDYTTSQLVTAMKIDPVFTANLLRLANSPFYRRGAEVTSLAVAVQRIGPRELVRLAMASTLSGLVRAGGSLQALRRRLWRQSLTSALVCEALSHLEGAEDAEAFVAGLLHDGGKLLVVEAIEDLHRSTERAPLEEAEARVLIERLHLRFGERLAEHWQLPGVFGAVIATHHDAPATLGPLTRRVVLADAVVDLIERQLQVTQTDLIRAGVAPPFAEPLAGLIPRIPPTLMAFEGGKAPAGTELARPRRTEGPYTVEVTGESALPWSLTRAREGALEVLAPRPLAEGLLLEVTVEPGTLHFWVVVGGCARSGQAWSTELTPYGLGAEQAEQWLALVARLRHLEAA